MHRSSTLISLNGCILSILPILATCANILILPNHVSSSHKKSLLPIGEILAEAGHNVTMWNAHYVKQPINNRLMVDESYVIETNDSSLLDMFVYLNSTGARDMWSDGDFNAINLPDFWTGAASICEAITSQHTDKINDLTRRRWDMVILDSIFSTCGILIAEMIKAPTVLISTSFPMPWTQHHRAVPQPINNAYTNKFDYDHTIFWHRFSHFVIERLYGAMGHKYAEYQLRKKSNGMLDSASVDKKFNFAKSEQNALMVFNMYPTMIDVNRPRTINEIFIGNRNCSDIKTSKLKGEFRQFVDFPGSKGTIYMAFGHSFSWSKVPNDTIKDMYCVFRSFSKYRVIWQYNGPPLDGFENSCHPNHISSTSNILVADWLPQMGILSDQSTKVFISHMGLKSFLEAVCAEVPVIAMPIYYEQSMNARLFKEAMGKDSLPYINRLELTQHSFSDSIGQVLNNFSRSKSKMVRLKSLMSDKPIKNAEQTRVWFKLVLRQGNRLKLLNLKAFQMNTIQYYNLDIIITVVAILVGFIIAMFECVTSYLETCL